VSDAEDRDLLAAEYVLGSLDPDEASAAEHLVQTDDGFTAAVRAWRERLAPLAQTVSSVAPPPELWRRIETSVAMPGGTVVELPPAPRPSWPGVRLWQATTAVALAIAAAFGAAIVLRSPPAPELALLAPPHGGAAIVAVRAGPGRLIFRAEGQNAAAPAGKDLELWALPRGAHRPQSLGVLLAGGRVVAAHLAPGTQLLVSLEPKGGSPTGLPTGPVIFAGRLERL
jgi:anti-sigma-K factor RskA